MTPSICVNGQEFTSRADAHEALNALADPEFVKQAELGGVDVVTSLDRDAATVALLNKAFSPPLSEPSPDLQPVADSTDPIPGATETVLDTPPQPPFQPVESAPVGDGVPDTPAAEPVPEGPAPVTDAQIIDELTKAVERANSRAPRGSFGWALALLRDGKRLAREGWNGQGQFVYLVGNDFETVFVHTTAGDEVSMPAKAFRPFLAIQPVEGNPVPWLASQTDMLARDWFVVD